MSKKFTKAEIAALTGAKISFTLEDGGRDLCIAKPHTGEIRDGLTWADIDQDATDADKDKAIALIPDLGGFGTQWGGWHLRKGYVSPTAGFDYCDPSSPHHY